MQTNLGQRNYAGQISQPQAPKELGYIQRLEGVRNGLDEITARLTSLGSKIIAAPPVTETNASAGRPPQGIPDHLNACEEYIRKVLTIVGGFEHTF